MEWRCAVAACDAPVGTPHATTCPYVETGNVLTSEDCLRFSPGNGRRVMTPATVRRVPNAPKTPLRSFRIPDDVYRAAQEKAAERGESVSDVVRKALERYAKKK